MTENEAVNTLTPFCKKLVAHRVALECRQNFYRTIVTADSERIVPLIGPAGVGKTAVSQRVQSMIVDLKRQEMMEDPGYLPFLSVKAVTGLDGNYAWKDGFARLLAAGKEPLISRKTTFSALRFDTSSIATSKGYLKDEFRRAFEAMVRNRRIRWLFIDEASAIIDETVNRHPLRQYNILKSLAVELNLVIGLISAYDVIGIRDGNGQLIRRQQIIHMQRYTLEDCDLERPEPEDEASVADAEMEPALSDLEEWSLAVDTLASAIPKIIQVDSDALADKKAILIRSVGCFGIFRDWLYRACIHALISNNNRLTREIMSLTALPTREILKLTIEAKIGESNMRDVDESELAKMYGLEAIDSKLGDVDLMPQKPLAKRRGTVGKRSPSRDPVGMTGG